MPEDTVTLPELNATGTSRDLRAEAIEAAGELASEPDATGDSSDAAEPTIEELRHVAGEDGQGLTDEQLREEYKKAQEAADQPEVTPVGFPLYDSAGNKIEDAAKVVLADLLSGKYQFGYNAMGKEVRKNINDLLRVASNGHYNETKMNRLDSERAMVYQQLQEARQQLGSATGFKGQVEKAFLAATQGNTKPLEKMIVDHMNAMGTEPARVDTSADQQAAGYQYFVTHISPQAYQIASEYGADGKEVAQAVLQMIANEPAQFMTEQRVTEILNYELPALLEQNGYARQGAKNGPANPLEEQVKTLTSTVQALQAQLANNKTQNLRDKQKRMPTGGAGSPPGAGEAMPEIKNRQQMKDFLQSR